MDTPTIRTARLVLRELTRGDVADLLPTFMDEGAMRYWSRGPVADEEELAGWLVPEEPWTAGRQWTIAESSDGPAIGRLIAVDRGDDIAEIGWLVAIDRQGQGIAAEAVAALLDHLFSVDGVRRVYADTDPDNVPSNRIAERFGFTLEGRLREQWRTHIGTRDSFIWGLLESEWKELSALPPSAP